MQTKAIAFDSLQVTFAKSKDLQDFENLEGLNKKKSCQVLKT